MEHLEAPCSYQGGKQRLAGQIVNNIEKYVKLSNENICFVDMCCGSGSVSIELINNFFNPANVYMVDKGCFGEFYSLISKNLFDLKLFKNEISKLPDKKDIQEYLKNLSNKPADSELWIYHYLLLQSGAFGSKQIWLNEQNQWKNNSFRSYWEPTETSNRKSIVNPMMPLSDTLYKRVEKIVNELSNQIHAYHCDILDDKIINMLQKLSESKGKENLVVYIDPPYIGTTGYQYNINIYECIERLKPFSQYIFISEGVKLEGATDYILLDSGRKKGNISGKVNKKPVEEWLNVYKKE